MRGSNFLPLAGNTFPGMPYHYWIGMTDLYHERRGNRSGWRWSDGAEAPPSSALQWQEGEPGHGNGIEDCIFQCFGTGKLCDVLCSNRYVPMCQPRSLPSSAARVRDFKAVAIPVGLPDVEFAVGGECSKKITNVESEMSCARHCSSEPKEGCVSFYFNAASRECRLVLYTDANSEHWRRRRLEEVCDDEVKLLCKAD